MSVLLLLLGFVLLIVGTFLAVKSVIRQKKGREDYKVPLKKARNCVIAGIVMFGVGMATSDDSTEKPKQETVAQEQPEAKNAQAEAEKPSTVNLDVTEQNKQDKAALEEYITSTLGGKYKVENLNTSTYPTDNGDTYGVFFDINKKYTDEQARDEARKIRDMLNAFPVPMDAVHITFKGVPTISYAPGNPEFVQVSGGQRTTFK